MSAGALVWAAALAVTLPAVRLSYLASAGRDRERLQWMGAGAVLAAGLALAVLCCTCWWRGLRRWPRRRGCCTVPLPPRA